MPPSPLPDISSNRRLALAALTVTMVIAVMLLWRDNDAAKALGDTDDAMRLVMVRDLLHGRGWYDQWIGRLQPPLGTYMHWSRLLDGALAGWIWLLERVMSPASAELMARIVWPLAWIFPAVCCGLVIARALGGSVAVFVCAILLATNIQLYVQFRPGRIDHHNVQITMSLIAAACSLARERRTLWAAVGGVAAALGLAIGIEALAFQALIGASFGYRLARNPQDAAPARAYGLALAASAALFYGIQTPPWRWSMSFCDALGWNLTAALAFAGLGLAAIATWCARLAIVGRLSLLLVLGVGTAVVFLGLDPQCLHGPFGAVDPRIRPFWFNKVQELRNWGQLLAHDRDDAIRDMTMAALAAGAALFLLVKERLSARPAVLLVAALVLVAAVAAAHAYRMQDYIYWFGMPTLAAAAGFIVTRGLNLLASLPARTAALAAILITLASTFVLSPICLALVVLGLINMSPKAAARPPKADPCFDRAPYAPLAALPAGVVLAEIDLGPFVLAESRDSVLAAPYHRMSWGILAAHDALGANPADAEARVRALNVTYVLECPSNPLRVGPGSFEADLRAGVTPPWLVKLSGSNEIMQIYRVPPQR